jgi:hypothetical protein
LTEVTRMGFPPQAWFDAERIRLQYTTVWGGLFDHMLTWDPTYFDDFWTVPGYLGANPRASLHDAKVQHKTRILTLVRPRDATSLGLPIPMAMRGQENIDDVPLAYELEDMPDADLTGARLEFTSGKASGHNVWISGRRGDYLDRHRSRAVRAPTAGHGRRRRARRQHLVPRIPDLPPPPGAARRVPEWDQFRVAGKPIFPQRPELLGPRFQRNNGTGLKSGRFAGKVIVVQSLFDEIVYPQQAAWYHRRVKIVARTAHR